MLPCYTCIYRRSIPGDCHSQCYHPALEPIYNDPVLSIFKYMPVAMPEFIQMAQKVGMNIKQHGIDNGWFAWPFNFDPVWADNCLLYEEKNNDL